MSPSVQKHPATFQCTLCPKRFTRAFTLRNHLRTTHTDDRPFVCTVCGKAFGRQHDRKTHEALHSGEKHFICRGDLESGTQWGCGKRFARATSLARHFRSERGRVCIRPLLEEERENQRRSNIPQEVANEQAEPTRREQLEAYDTFLASDTFRPAPSLSNLCSMLDGPIPTRFLIRTEHDNAPTYLCLMLLMKTIMKEKGIDMVDELDKFTWRKSPPEWAIKGPYTSSQVTNHGNSSIASPAPRSTETRPPTSSLTPSQEEQGSKHPYGPSALPPTATQPTRQSYPPLSSNPLSLPDPSRPASNHSGTATSAGYPGAIPGGFDEPFTIPTSWVAQYPVLQDLNLRAIPDASVEGVRRRW